MNIFVLKKEKTLKQSLVILLEENATDTWAYNLILGIYLKIYQFPIPLNKKFSTGSMRKNSIDKYTSQHVNPTISYSDHF